MAIFARDGVRWSGGRFCLGVRSLAISRLCRGRLSRMTEQNRNLEESGNGGAANNPLHGRKVLSFVRRSARLDARLQRALDNYADEYILSDIALSEGSLDPCEGFVFSRDYVQGQWGTTIR